MAAAVTVVVLVGAIAGVGFLVVNHALGMIHRISGIAALTAAHQPVMPAISRGSMTVLLTGAKVLPTSRVGDGALDSSGVPEEESGLIALVHLNAGDRGGAVVSIPPDAVVDIPGHGRLELWRAMQIGGPSLLIRSVEHLTNVRINHYSVLDFSGVSSVVSALNGVDVTVPAPFSSDGVAFPAGTDDLNASTVLPYVRQSDVSEVGRTLLEQNLIRAILTKIGQEHLFGPVADDNLIDDTASALSVDSNFSDEQLIALMVGLSRLRGRDGVFVSAATTNGSPTAGGDQPVYLNRVIDGDLWQAIRHDSVRTFARRFPTTVTPTSPF